MTTLRALVITVLFVTVTLLVLPLQWLAVMSGGGLKRSIPLHYHRFICALFGVRVRVVGALHRGGVLLTANHSGWLDIPILSALAPVSFVSKAEVRLWPFFGTLARMQRTIFIRRERAKAMVDRDQIRARLLQGECLVIFPEGTSSDGNRVLPFGSALLSAAFDPSPVSERTLVPIPIQPVSIAYVGLYGIPIGRENRPLFAWYGDMELVPHLWEALKTGPIEVIVEFHPVLASDAPGGRKEVAARCEAAVRVGLVRAMTGSNAPAEPAHRDEAVIEAMDEAENEPTA